MDQKSEEEEISSGEGTDDLPASKSPAGPYAEHDADRRQHHSCACCCRPGYDLKRCTACKSVWYCDVICQKDHRKAHKKECKKIANDLKEGKLPVSDLEAMQISDGKPDLWNPPPGEECPICEHILPSVRGTRYQDCCVKTLCTGCFYSHCKYTTFDGTACPYCRTPRGSDYERVGRIKDRVEKNDPCAMAALSEMLHQGSLGVKVDKAASMELIYRSAELGEPNSLDKVGFFYATGTGVEKDFQKAQKYWESASAKGSVRARKNLGTLEYKRKNVGLAVRHWRIAAACGEEGSFRMGEDLHSDGMITGMVFNASKRAYEKARDELDTDGRKEHNWLNGVNPQERHEKF